MSDRILDPNTALLRKGNFSCTISLKVINEKFSKNVIVTVSFDIMQYKKDSNIVDMKVD